MSIDGYLLNFFMIINYLNKVFMKSKKVMESRKAPPSRLIVDEYDLIKK